MFSSLRGISKKIRPGIVTLDVSGVGYMIFVPLSVWDSIEEGIETELSIYTYVREDRLELFGFSDWSKREVFAHMMRISGIGPSLGLELCGVPGALLARAISEKDSDLLTKIKGVGAKRAEKLLVELSSVLDAHPEAFSNSDGQAVYSEFDNDAVEALRSLGYDNRSILDALKRLPQDIKTTEERVTAALRSL